MTEVKLNVQQVPKSAGYLETWVPRPGHTLLQLDFAAVEPTVLAEFSKCPNYRKLYGPGASGHHCVYLFVGSRFPMYRDKFLAHYDLDSPTKEGVAYLKKTYKNDRAVCKEAHLSMQYGAGPPTVHSTLIRNEIDIADEDVVEMHQAYWSDELFAVVKEYESRKRREWNRNNGWILNCVGRPVAVPEEKRKDLLSRVIQSSAHDLLQRFIYLLERQRQQHRIPMWPWIVDIHDESIWEIETSAAEAGIAAMTTALAQMNEELAWEIKIKGEPQLARNLACIKVEGYV